MIKLRCKYLFLLSYILLPGGQEVTAQQINVRADSAVADTSQLPESGLSDSTFQKTRTFKVASSGLESPVTYSCRDSSWFDITRKQLHLAGGARVLYKDLEITAAYIVLDYGKNEVLADQQLDSSRNAVEPVSFKDGSQDVAAAKLRYNFKSQKGIVYEARTRQDDLYVVGEKAKFIGGAQGDTTNAAGQAKIFNYRAIITTCDDPHPHFGIRTQKLKVIPNKLIVTGLSNVEIAGIPTPLVLPFGFYPITKTRKAGLIIPRDFEFADAEGLGLRDFGWYQPINDHMDVSTLFNLYTSGSWGISATTRYQQRYRFNSNLRLRFNSRVSENAMAQRVTARSFGISLSHNQDPKAHPTRKFGGSVNIETNRDQNRNRNDYNSVYQNTLSSNLTFSKSFPGRPFQMTAALTHSQNTATRQMNISLPNINFTMQRVYPFKRKTPTGKETWYEKISLNYSSTLRNDFTAVDTQLFTRKTLQEARMGIQHRASTDYNIKIFNYLNIAPAVSLEENWYPYSIEKILKPETRLVYDTIYQNGEIVGINLNESKSQYGIDSTLRNWGFYSYRQASASVSANTALFFTRQFKHGWFRGIRHTMKPSVSMGFGPDFASNRFNRFYRTVETDLRPLFNDTLTYSPFEQGIFGRPPTVRNTRDLIMSYSLINVLEFKYYSAKRDTIIKKRIFDNLGFSGNYNFSADSLNFSTFGTGGLFRLFKGIVNLTWNATFDPYLADAQGRRVGTFALLKTGAPVRVTNLGLQINSNCSVRQLRDLFHPEKESKPVSPPPTGERPTVKDLGFIDWFDNFRLSHRISFERRLIPTGFGTARDTFVVGNHNLSVAGSLQLSNKWALIISNIGYDFQSSQLVYPDLGFSRDLHCWTMSLSWQPVRGTYLFSINVKPGTLDFLKVPYRKNNFDARL